MNGLKETKRLVRKTKKDVFVHQDPPYTYVEVKMHVMGEEYHAVGFSKCNPVDEWDNELGIEIARGRAEHKVAQMVARRFATLDSMLGPTRKFAQGIVSFDKPRQPDAVSCQGGRAFPK